MRTVRIGPGEYEVTDGNRTVYISRYYWCKGAQWVARAAWDKHLYTDPKWTLREAKKEAEFMLRTD